MVSNTCITGSNFTKYTPIINTAYVDFRQLAAQWNIAQKTAHDEQYITYSHSDSGPKEYQISKQAKNCADLIYNGASNIISGIKIVEKKAPFLEQKVREYVGVTLDKKKGDANQLRREVMALPRDMYAQNYEDGLDVQPFKWSMVALWTAAGALVGGAAGYGVDRVIALKQGSPLRRQERHFQP